MHFNSISLLFYYVNWTVLFLQKRLLLLLQLMFIGLVGISVVEVDSFTESISVNSFEFTHTNGTILSLSSYSDKPILLEWGASWCSTCHINLATMNELYPEFGNDINFISLSYGGESFSTTHYYTDIIIF